MNMSCVTVFGGTGFLGRAVVDQLIGAGATVRVAARHPGAFKVASGRDRQLVQLYADVRDETSIGSALEGCDAVVNAVGLYSEKGSETFRAVHELGAMRVARLSARAGAKALVHMSGIGADLFSQSKYVRSRAEGELLVKAAFPAANVLRPSVLFGPYDKFLNTLVAVTRLSPVLFLFGDGDTRLQPVYVDDVAEAVLRALTTGSSQGKVYELGGPQTYQYKDIIKLVLKETGRARILVPLPFFAWDALARLLMLLPNPPLTTDVVTLMKRDNLVGERALTFVDLGLTPTAMEPVLHDMLASRP